MNGPYDDEKEESGDEEQQQPDKYTRDGRTTKVEQHANCDRIAKAQRESILYSRRPTPPKEAYGLSDTITFPPATLKQAK